MTAAKSFEFRGILGSVRTDEGTHKTFVNLDNPGTDSHQVTVTFARIEAAILSALEARIGSTVTVTAVPEYTPDSKEHALTYIGGKNPDGSPKTSPRPTGMHYYIDARTQLGGFSAWQAAPSLEPKMGF